MIEAVGTAVGVVLVIAMVLFLLFVGGALTIRLVRKILG